MTRRLYSRADKWSTAVAAGALLIFVTGCGVLTGPKPVPPPAAVAAVSVQVPARDVALPTAASLQKLVDETYAMFKDEKGGKNADYIPYLASVPSNLFGVAMVTVDGQVFTAGDANYAFSIQSCSKVFTLALAMQESGPDEVLKKVGVEPSGLPFNSLIAVELHNGRPVNPLVNAGAMATVSMIKANSAAERWGKIIGTYDKFAGEKLAVLDEVYRSESATNFRNRGIAYVLYNAGNFYSEPIEAVDVYTKQCSVGVTAKQLAVMGATLANGGVNPITKERCLDTAYVPKVLAVMMMAGFYDEAGAWAYSAGVPAKTGVGGGIVAVIPGKIAVVGFSPPLTPAGNSVRAMKAINHIVDALHLNLFDGAH